MKIEWHTKANYSVEEWLEIFKQSEMWYVENGLQEEPRIPFELVCTEIMGMSNYDNYKDYYWGFAFLETISIISNTMFNEYLKDLDLKILKADGSLNEEFTSVYLAVCHMTPLNNNLNWGGSIRTAWFDFQEFTPINLHECGLILGDDQVFPLIKEENDCKVFFAALLKYYDNYLVEMGEERYKELQHMFNTRHPNDLDYSLFCTKEYAEKWFDLSNKEEQDYNGSTTVDFTASVDKLTEFCKDPNFKSALKETVSEKLMKAIEDRL